MDIRILNMIMLSVFPFLIGAAMRYGMRKQENVSQPLAYIVLLLVFVSNLRSYGLVQTILCGRPPGPGRSDRVCNIQPDQTIAYDGLLHPCGDRWEYGKSLSPFFGKPSVLSGVYNLYDPGSLPDPGRFGHGPDPSHPKERLAAAA